MALEQTVEIVSPNNVLANAMLRSIDMIRPRLQASRAMHVRPGLAESLARPRSR